MNVMRYRGHAARVEYDADDRLFLGRLAGIDDSVTFHADSVSGLEAAFRLAVDDYVATCAKVGKTPEKPYSGNMMVRVSPEVHRRAALAAELSGRSLAGWAEEALTRAVDRAVAHTGEVVDVSTAAKRGSVMHGSKRAVARMSAGPRALVGSVPTHEPILQGPVTRSKAARKRAASRAQS